MFPKCQIAAQLCLLRRYCKASQWSSQLRLIDMIDMVSPWSQAQAILGFDGGGLMPIMLQPNRLSRMCCDVQVYDISLEAPLSEAVRSLDWDIGLVVFAVAIESAVLSDIFRTQMQNRRLNDSPTSVLSSHAGCARSNATLRPLLMTVDASAGGPTPNTNPGFKEVPCHSHSELNREE
ncbi:hypothetical protein J3E68DRAFT_434411 [Trichoderma sp. SZMC 28012]